MSQAERFDFENGKKDRSKFSTRSSAPVPLSFSKRSFFDVRRE